MAVGAITGAGVYVAGVVSGVVNIFSNTRITVIPRVFLRDLSFYTIGLLILIASSFTKGISIPFCVAFLLWYAVFIVIVAIEDLCERIRNNREAREAKAREEREESLLEGEEEDDQPRRKKSAWEIDTELEA